MRWGLWAFVALSWARHFGSFVENKGQIYAEARFESRWRANHIYLTPDGLAFLFVESDLAQKVHGRQWAEAPIPVRAHFVRIRWVGGRAVEPEGLEPETTRYNFFLGSWRGVNARGFRQVLYREIYPGVSLRVRFTEKGLKWDWEAQSPAALSRIRLQYEGVGLSVEEQRLGLHTCVGTFWEEMPAVYEAATGKPLAARYVLEGAFVRYELVDSKTRAALVVDPVVVFSTYSGSYSDNWGFTATYDLLGNAYAGGNVNDGLWQWNPGGVYFPVTPGVVQGTFGGGVSYGSNQPIFWGTDIALWKANSTGTTRLWATYLGGSNNEQPHSLVTDPQGNLYILGATRSANFPTTPTAYQPNLAGNIDIVVCALSANGDQLLGSTYLGGSGEDGLNSRVYPLYYFYADDGRGEAILSDTACYIISSTRSSNFPITSGAFQTQRKGGMDAVICKLSLDLSQLYASTYLGGSGADAGYSIRIGANGLVYTCGGTNSTDFPTSGNSYQPTYQGGRADGWLAVLDSDLRSVLLGTYWGTPAYDQVFMIDLDRQGFVWGAGHTEGTLSATPGAYSTPDGKQFVFSMDDSLSQVTRLSVWGSLGSTTPNITISAFAADRCGYIYVSGWGGLDVGNGPEGSTVGLPTTANANQTTTDGADFYVVAFSPNLTGLAYASFWGGNLAQEHVDGGTSRFDNRGIIYQSVCGGCGGFSDFPTTAGTISATNNSPNCNNALFKIDFQLGDPVVAAAAITPRGGCAPFTATIQNLSQNGVSYYWDFGNGQTSTAASPPSVTYAQPGTYTLTLVATNLATCNERDTLRRVITVYARPTANFRFSKGCGLTATFLAEDSTALGYSWDFGDGNTAQGRFVTYTYSAAGSYTVRLVVWNAFCADTFSQVVSIQPSPVEADFSWSGDSCRGVYTFTNLSQSASSYLWVFQPGDSSRAISPTFGFPMSGTYTVTLIAYDSLGCSDTVRKTIQVSRVVRAAWELSIDYCALMVVLRDVSAGGGWRLWLLGDGTQSTASTLTHTYAAPGTYQLTLIALSSDSLCADTLSDSIAISPYSEAIAQIRVDTCQSRVLFVSRSRFSGSVAWYVENQLVGAQDSFWWQAPGPGAYGYQLITNPQGPAICQDTASGFVVIPARVGLDSLTYEVDLCGGWVRFGVPLSPDKVLFVQAEGVVYPAGTVSLVLPLRNPYVYQVIVGYFDSENCLDTLIYTISGDELVKRALFVPNAFSPNGDGINDVFRITGSLECILELSIYDRWGNLLYVTNSVPFSWDGRLRSGELAPEGAYVYVIRFADLVRAGTVSLLR